MNNKVTNLFFDLPQKLIEYIYEYDPTYKKYIYNKIVKEISHGIHVLQPIFNNWRFPNKRYTSTFDNFQKTFEYKFQCIEYSTALFFDSDANLLDFNIFEDDRQIAVNILVKCKFLTKENKIIFFAIIFIQVNHFNCNNILGYYPVHMCIIPCYIYDSCNIPKININAQCWSGAYHWSNGKMYKFNPLLRKCKSDRIKFDKSLWHLKTINFNLMDQNIIKFLLQKND